MTGKVSSGECLGCSLVERGSAQTKPGLCLRSEVRQGSTQICWRLVGCACTVPTLRVPLLWLRDRGMPAQVLKVITDELGGPWDGIYANAVFLHLDVGELTAVLGKTAAAVRPGGVLGSTLKEGDGAGWTTEKLGDPATSATGGNPV